MQDDAQAPREEAHDTAPTPAVRGHNRAGEDEATIPGAAIDPVMAQDLRAGCNEVEAAMVWAIATGDPAVTRAGLACLDEGARAQIEETLARLDALDERARARVLDLWRSLDATHDDPVGVFLRADAGAQRALVAGLPPRWHQAARQLVERPAQRTAWSATHAQLVFGTMRDTHHHQRPSLIAVRDERFEPGMLCGFDGQSVLHACRRIGVFALAEVIRPRERRQVAGLLRQLPAQERGWLVRDLQRTRDVDPREVARVQEVFIGLRSKQLGWSEVFKQLGLYLLAASAGRRHQDRLRRIADALSREDAHTLMRYARMSQRSSRGLVDEPLCRAIALIHDELLPPSAPVPSHHERGGRP